MNNAQAGFAVFVDDGDLHDDVRRPLGKYLRLPDHFFGLVRGDFNTQREVAQQLTQLAGALFNVTDAILQHDAWVRRHSIHHAYGQPLPDFLQIRGIHKDLHFFSYSAMTPATQTGRLAVRTGSVAPIASIPQSRCRPNRLSGKARLYCADRLSGENEPHRWPSPLCHKQVEVDGFALEQVAVGAVRTVRVQDLRCPPRLQSNAESIAPIRRRASCPSSAREFLPGPPEGQPGCALAAPP